MLAELRKNRLLRMLAEEQKIIVTEAARALGVSLGTIRSDLKALEEEGRLVRTHGGAIPVGSSSEPAFGERQLIRFEQKAAIGRAAAGLIGDSVSIMLDASSTAMELAKRLPEERPLSVITNGLSTAQLLAAKRLFNVIVTGGVVRPGSDEVEGLLAKSLFDQVHADILFASAHGLTLDQGMTEFSYQEAELKRVMAANVPNVVALVDSSKLGRRSLATSVELSRIRTVVTDQGADPAFLNALRERGIAVVIAGDDA